MSMRHHYVVGHITREALVTEGGNPRTVVVRRPIDRKALAAVAARFCDPGTAKALTFGGVPMKGHQTYVVVSIHDGGFVPSAAAFCIEMHERHGCDVADIDHGCDPTDPRAAWGHLLAE